MRFRDISEIQQLIDQRAREVPALEFKSDAPLENEAAKRKLLRDVTSMGNSGGGTIIFGLTADDTSGVGFAKEFSPLDNPSFASTIENIVRDVVRPPLLWTLAEFEVGAGLVVVADVRPSILGPYMIQGYGDNRYYRRGEVGVVEMTEYEISRAYEMTGRSAAHRNDEWRSHFLPIATQPSQPWLSIAALPFEPFTPIFDGKEVDPYQILHPEGLGNCLYGLPIHQSFVRHWADGITADDSRGGQPLTFALRLHRDGAAGIIQKWEDFIDMAATARAVNAYLAYLADFWSTYSLRSPIELDVGIVGIANVLRASTMMGSSSSGIVHPPGMTVSKVGINKEVLPWELRRAHVRHSIVRELVERLSYSFDWPSRGELFSYGRLFVRGGGASNFALGPGRIVQPRPAGAEGIANIDCAGRVRGNSGDVNCFAIDGAIIDRKGNTLAVVEMNDSVACPSDFLADYAVASRTIALAPWTPGTDNFGGPSVPAVTGKWSDGNINQAVA